MTSKDKPGDSLEFVTIQDDNIEQEKLKRALRAKEKANQSNQSEAERRSGEPRRDGVDRREMIRFEEERRALEERRSNSATWDTL